MVLPLIYHYLDESRNQQGPFDEKDIHRFLVIGKINADTLIWKKGTKDWIRIDASEFKDKIPKAAPIAPPSSSPCPSSSPQPNPPSKNSGGLSKTWQFAFAGAGGGFLANGFSELIPDTTVSLFDTSLWSIIICLGIAAALLLMQNKMMCKSIVNRSQILPLLLGSIIGGGLAGFVAQFGFSISAQFFMQYKDSLVAALTHDILSRSIAWGVMGGIIAYGMTFFIPNLNKKWSPVGGAIGGFIGCFGFIVIYQAMLIIGLQSDIPSRLLGMLALGGAIGMCIGIVESICKEAWLIVVYAPKEQTQVNLGKTPVSVGSGVKDTIYCANVAESQVVFRFDSGQIFCKENGNERMVKIGDNVNVGSLTIQVNGATTPQP